MRLSARTSFRPSRDPILLLLYSLLLDVAPRALLARAMAPLTSDVVRRRQVVLLQFSTPSVPRIVAAAEGGSGFSIDGRMLGYQEKRTTPNSCGRFSDLIRALMISDTCACSHF
jgi:hypothetical protein